MRSKSAMFIKAIREVKKLYQSKDLEELNIQFNSAKLHYKAPLFCSIISHSSGEGIIYLNLVRSQVRSKSPLD